MAFREEFSFLHRNGSFVSSLDLFISSLLSKDIFLFWIFHLSAGTKGFYLQILSNAQYQQYEIISNYWMRLSSIWRILQVEESVIHRGQRPRWITPSEICRILHILRKPNSIIALLFIQNIIFAQTCKLYSRPFLSLLNDTALCPGFLGQWFNNLWRQWFYNLQRAALLTSFWRQWFNNLQRNALLTSLV